MENSRQSFQYSPLYVLRGAACLMILAFHVWNPGLILPKWLALYPWLFIPNGYLGVWIFFILSGYLIGKGFFSHRYVFSPKGILLFYKRRFLTLAPLYYSIVLLLFLPLTHINWPLFMDFLMFRASSHINEFYLGYLWTISSVMQFYLVAPVFYGAFLWLSRKRISPITTGMLIFTYIVLSRLVAMLWYTPETGSDYTVFIYASPFLNGGLFLSGFFISSLLYGDGKHALARLSLNAKAKRWFWRCQLILFILTNYWLLQLLYRYSLSFAWWYTIVITPLIALNICLVIYLIERESSSPVRRPALQVYGFSRISVTIFRFLTIVGVYSYSLYIFHVPFIYLSDLNCFPSGCLPEMFVVFFALTVLCGLAFAFVIESKKCHLVRE